MCTSFVFGLEGDVSISDFFSGSQFPHHYCVAGLAYYANRKEIEESVYIVFISNEIQIEGIEEAKETIDGVEVKTYLIRYDEATDFGEN